MQSHDGEGDETHDEQPSADRSSRPPTDDELRAELLRILDEDPDCPIPERARTHGTKDPTLLWEVTSYLLVTVNRQSRTSVRPLRAYLIVRDELEDRTHQWALD
ncbi:MAG: hypothetical protein M3O50_00335 [Myxococcota bacterium]|nr:hypothetical protein [Myxococcota bacterium]